MNLAKLKRSNAPAVMCGPHTDKVAEVDHTAPLAGTGQIVNELADLELLPAVLDRANSNKVSERLLAPAKSFHDAGLLSNAEFADMEACF